MASGRYFTSTGKRPAGASGCTSKSGTDSTRTKPLVSAGCGGVSAKVASGFFQPFSSRSAMMTTLNCVSGLSPFFVRRMSVRPAPGSWRMLQSSSASPVICLISPSPVIASASSFGSPCRMSNVASM